MAITSDVLVVGGGLAAVTAAVSAAREGADVRLVSHKASTLRQASGLIDALGYVPATEPAKPLRDGPPTAGRELDPDEWPDPEGPLADPFEGIDRLPESHPYRIVGGDALRDGLDLFDDLAGDAYRGGHTERNALVPTFGGAVKPTARYPAAAEAGLASDDRPMLVVGFRSLTEYDARAFAGRLEAAGVPFDVAGAEVEFAEAFRADAKITRLAKALDHDEAIDGVPAREALAKAVSPHLHDVVDEDGGVDRVERVGFPAFLGDDRGDEVRAELADRLGADVFEIPMGPPSLPGLRLEDRLFDALDAEGVRFETGNPVVGVDSASDGRVEAVAVDRKGRTAPYGADAFVLATGGLVGKGLDSDREGAREPVFDLYVDQPDDRYEWFVDDAFGDQPYARFGVRPDERCRPTDADGAVQYENVFAAGGVVGGADAAREKSASGVSLATGIVAGRQAATEANQ
ncbi:anaerobic glycerol-3-phosphate dehydrogenase subunit B [Halorubrum distributum JCM 9100]|uniref:Anaerobic glycerol-3-phosphate dehydrogenase subunit B n=2 Tax=Halorubrum distributum TaxID=29283 RepID=M0ETD3_9EURY|nr:glycerol-3-phosphate dehydrogenase subunit GlpB [Halorubrum distributum]ELZ50955.1 anaerobic glycerol-3-phosphate dehydrogenase subunit B [Halorubrum distributum JCM 9100]ELZ52947.1 anaerobic glycerol-3-phosphate dehydrogenase subunit B [Halorubrum distributum JCM 10118]